MNPSRGMSLSMLALLLLLGGCATRRSIRRSRRSTPTAGTRCRHGRSTSRRRTISSSSPSRAAAPAPRRSPTACWSSSVVPRSSGRSGERVRLLDAVDVITGVSGGSFTALAYGLYGEKLFADYEQRFLKRDVQGELIARAFSPTNWGKLSSSSWGRSELAEALYDEILFNGATFGDLKRGNGPFIIVSATDLSSGARFPFTQTIFNVLCSDVEAVPLSRAAAASSAVPVVLSPVTINNYGGTCNFDVAAVGGALRRLRESAAARGARDPGAAGSRGLRRRHSSPVPAPGGRRRVRQRGHAQRARRDAVARGLHGAGIPTPLDHVRRIIVLVVNSLSSPPVKWDESDSPPGTVDVLLKSVGVPIDHYSYEAVELLKDISARWQTIREVRNLAGCSANANSPVCSKVRGPDADIYAIDVSFAALADTAERDYLNRQPTSFVLPGEAVDRLRAAAGTIILASPEFQRLLKDVGATVVAAPPGGAAAAAAPQ